MRLLTISAAAVLAVLLGDPSTAVAADRVDGQQRPDVVIFMLDDVPHLDGLRLWRAMPNIRRVFLDQGVRFSQMFGESPLCCPGRAGWLTGLHTFNHGVDANDVHLFDPSMTLATQLDGIGYETILAGKYFNGYQSVAPDVPPGWDHFHATTGAYYHYTIWNDGHRVGEQHGGRPDDYSTDVITAKAVADIRRTAPSERIFAWLAPNAVHGPTTPAARHLRDPRCASIPSWRPANYDEGDVSDKPAFVRSKSSLDAPAYDLVDECRTLLAVDDAVGAVREELARQDRLDDTLLVLTSDNGMNAGAHRLLGKSTPYATQVPFFVSWPGVLGTGGDMVAERVSNIDLAPTICDLAGCALGPYPNGQRQADGRSFASLLLGTGAGPGRDALLEDMPAGSKDIPVWYALATTQRSPLSEMGCWSSARGGCRWHYVEYGTGARELYDVSNGPCWTWRKGEPGDPCELHNLAGRPEYRQLRSALSSRLAQLKAEGGRND